MSEFGTLKNMINNTEVTDFTIDGKCSECGNCCTRALALSNKEINTIKAYIKRHGIKEQIHSVNVLAERCYDWTCPFLDDTKPNHKCTIYEVRPLLCRDFNCRKYLLHEEPNKQLFKEPRRAVDMRELFFGNNG